MTSVDDVRSWLADTGADTACADRTWGEFAALPKPVVTVFGAYDTGKSSLIRRVLVDAGVAVPDWLTISARHETFETSEIDLGPVLLRDTPGLAIDGTDVRAKNNTATARDALALTDVGVITMTSQLATAEVGELRSQIKEGWSPGNLWFIITRFDEAGIDPYSDLAGYRALAERKKNELRQALNLGDDATIHVVSQDFAGMAGAVRQPSAELWEMSHEWDGMATLEHALEGLSGVDLPGIRKAAGARYWRTIARGTLDELRSERNRFERHHQEAVQSHQQVGRWHSEVDSLDGAAVESLRGTIADTLGRTRHLLAADQDAVVSALQTALAAWHQDQVRELDRVLQGLVEARDTQRAEATWLELDDLLTDGADSDDEIAEAVDGYGLVEHIVSTIGPALVTALVEYNKLSNTPLGRRGEQFAGHAGGGGVDAAAVAKAALPVILQAARLFDDHRKAQATAAAEREWIDNETARLGAHVIKVAQENWTPVVAEAHQAVDDAFGAHATAAAKLEAQIAGLTTLIVRGESLLC